MKSHYGLGLKDPKGHWAPAPVPWAGMPPTKLGCPGPTQRGPECLQGRGTHSVSGQ